MVPLVRHDLCPQCHGTHLSRLERRYWMRRIPRSKYYECLDCRCLFLRAEELFRIATLTTLAGIAIFSFSYFSDDFGIGHPGRGTVELAGIILGICEFLFGLACMLAFSKTPVRSLPTMKTKPAIEFYSEVPSRHRMKDRGTQSEEQQRSP